MIRTLLASGAIAVVSTQAIAKDIADIDVGDRICWTGWTFDSYGRVLSKNYGNDTVRVRLDNDRTVAIPADEIRSPATCRGTRILKDEGWALLRDAITGPSDKDNQN